MELRATWVRFVEELADGLLAAGDEVLDPELPELDRAEGLRALLRDTRMSIQRVVEHLDDDYPVFHEIYSDTYHLVGDTPDYTIHAALVDGSREYVVRGRVGASDRFNLTSQGPREGSPDAGYMVSLLERTASSEITGTLDDTDLDLEPDGSFEIHVGPTEPSSGNWLPTRENTTLVLVRNEFHAAFTEHWRWSPTKLEIAAARRPESVRPLDEAALAEGLRRVASEIGVPTPGRRLVSEKIRSLGENAFSYDDSIWKSGGANPRTVFAAGYYSLAPDQALVIDVDTLPDSSFWVLVLTNMWMETLDFRHSRVNLNKATAALRVDGGLRVVLAARDPGVPNWLSTTGHEGGAMMWRWNYPVQAPPTPRTRIVPVDDVAGLA